jgi:hypothetical protein
MPQTRCKNVNGQILCGKLHSGGKAVKKGIYNLAKGEHVVSPLQIAKLRKTGSTTTKKRATKHKKVKCKCKH